LTTFATDRALGGEFFIETVMTVVATQSAARTIAQFAEARRQVMLADRIVLSKGDIADEDAADIAARHIQKLNPRAEIVTADHGVLEPRRFLAVDHDGLPGSAAARFMADAGEVEHTDDVRSFTLVERGPIAWEPFARAMETLIAMRGPDLLRVKGFLHVEG